MASNWPPTWAWSPGSWLRLQSASGEANLVRVGCYTGLWPERPTAVGVDAAARRAKPLGYWLDITEIYVRTDQLFEAETWLGQLSASTG